MALFSSNMPSTISSGSVFAELLRVARRSLRTDDFIPRDPTWTTKNDFSSLPKCFSKIRK